MMNTDGNSAEVPAVDTTAQTFGLTGDTISTPEAAPLVETKPEEGQKVDDGEVDTTTPKSADKTALLLEKKTREQHKLMIDTIDHQFKLMQTGKLQKEDLKSWFETNPGLADIANRSKRVKETFRNLMAETSAPKQAEAKLLEADETKPLTIADLKRWEAEKEETFQLKVATTERQKKLQDFAVSKKIVDDDYKQLQTTAEVLATVNKSWTFDQAIEASHRALFGGKRSSINIGGSMNYAPSEVAPEKLDMQKGVQLMTMDEFSGKKR